MTGLAECAAASRARAIAALLLPDGNPVPGYACDECGALTTADAGCDCADAREQCRGVPDVFGEMANRTLDGGGEVTAVREAPFAVGARLRFPVPAGP